MGVIRCTRNYQQVNYVIEMKEMKKTEQSFMTLEGTAVVFKRFLYKKEFSLLRARSQCWC